MVGRGVGSVAPGRSVEAAVSVYLSDNRPKTRRTRTDDPGRLTSEKPDRVVRRRIPASAWQARDQNAHPRRAGRSPGWWHRAIPPTSRRAYRTDARGRSVAWSGADCVESRPRAPARSVWRQVDGMALSRRRGERGRPLVTPGNQRQKVATDRSVRKRRPAGLRSARGVTANVGRRRKQRILSPRVPGSIARGSDPGSCSPWSVRAGP